MKFLAPALLVVCCSFPAFAGFAELVKSGDVHDARSESDAALQYYLPAEKLDPNNGALLVKISRQYALRMNDLPNKAYKIASGKTALAYAERAVAAAPRDCDSHLALAICLGKLTPYIGAKEKIEASRRIKTAADRAVALDSRNDYAWHLLGRDEAGLLQAYLRVVDPGVKYAEPSIGRVITSPETRGSGLGRVLMSEGITRCEAAWPAQGIRISAQAHLAPFYRSLGFATVGGEYLEDNIPHVEMLRGA